MTLDELIAQFRVDADDLADGQLFTDEELTVWFNEAQDEAAIRSRLLYETDLPAMCSYPVTAGSAVYPLHEAVHEIAHVQFVVTGDTEVRHLDIMDRVELDRIDRNWRSRTGTPRYLIQDDTRLTLAPKPDSDGVLTLEVYRLPLDRMQQEVDTPEIAAVHHLRLVDWVMFRAFSKPDGETMDPTRAAAGETRFTKHFGLRPDADARRLASINQPQHNKAIW